ncbi:MAG: hypothetical protein EA428_10985 [Spirochaetaceae bacterium]|nr:MAG: hypothetical protein EA428_10985 [Spirochaetaceae bacterium]
MVYAPQLSYARGAREDPIDEAKSLIDARRHNDAMLILQEIVRRQPERIDEVEKLLREIRGFRTEYNQLFSELLLHISTNPEDLERTLALIAAMEALDEHPNPRVREQIAQSRIIAQLAYDRRIAEGLRIEARALIAENRHDEAAERYLQGFALQQPEFENRGYSDLLGNEVRQIRNEIRSLVTQFLQLRPDFLRAGEELAHALTTPRAPDERSASFRAWINEASRIEALEEDLRALSQRLTAARDSVELEFPEDPIDWHLNILRFMLGEIGPEADRDGIYGAFVQQIDDFAYAIAGDSREYVADLNQQADTSLIEGRLAQAQAEYQNIAEIIEYATRLVLLASRLEPVDIPGPTLASELILDHGRNEYLLSFAEFSRAAERTQAVAALDAARQHLEIAPIQDLDSDWERRSELQNSRESFSDILGRWSRSALELESAFDLPPELNEYQQATAELHGELLQDLIESELSWVLNLVEESYAAVEEPYLGLLASINEGETFLSGIPLEGQVIEDDEDQILARYPDRALDVLSPTELSITELEETLLAFMESYNDEANFIQQDEAFQERIREHELLLARLRATQLQVADLIEASETDILRAAELNQEGESFISQTEAAIQQLRVPDAQSLWNEARDRFYDSLALQENDAIRARVEDLAVSLGARIQDAANELVVQRVRELIDDAEDLYNREEFLTAQEMLNEASELWAQTNVEDNVEITRLTRLVNAALTFENERSIVETDPLYPVLGSYLSLAQDDFHRARTLVAQGSSQQAQMHLARSEQNLENVIALRPFNWEAKVLILRIEELRDTDNFDAIFERRFNEVIENRRPDNALETLSDLQVLKEIKPNYPGIDRLIAELEIELGLRPDPVTQARAQRSIDLYRQATQVAGGGIAQDRAAIGLLEESVSLNPGNRDARLLLDTLRIRTGGQATVALSSTDEQQFRRAEQLFIQGSVAQAFGIVERLLQDESNQGYPPLLDLRRRITSRLGV